MTEKKVFVTNAGDEEQVKEAVAKEKTKFERDINDIATVLSTKEGRRFLWRLLGECKVFETIWHNSALIHYNAGRQDIGHFVMAEITRTSEKAFIEMMKENAKGEK